MAPGSQVGTPESLRMLCASLTPMPLSPFVVIGRLMTTRPRCRATERLLSRSMGDRVAPAAAAAGRCRGAGEQDGAHRLGGDAAREGIPAQGCGGLVAHGTGAGACERAMGTVGRSDATERSLPFHWDIDPARMMRPRFADSIRASSPSGQRQQAGHMTASDFCAARYIFSCQAGAIQT
jgi:hypothetical protein